MKKSALNKLVLESLEEPFYLNVATFKITKDGFLVGKINTMVLREN